MNYPYMKVMIMEKLYKKQDNPSCIICNNNPPTSIRGGLIIKNRLICSACEERIINTPVDDEFYTVFKQGLKHLWSMES